jgi:cardiolipin synthase
MQLTSWLSLHGLVVFFALMLYIWTTHSLRQRRHPSSAIAWLLSLFFLPYVALPLYMLFGNRKVNKPMPASPAAPFPHGDALQALSHALGLPPATHYTSFALHQDGAQAYAALLNHIQGARQSLEICTFVLGRDAIGHAISAALMQQARAGVRVRLLLDGVGRYLGGWPVLHELRHAGVDVRIFVPLFSSARAGRTNLRNHRKMVVADGNRLWTGGRNLAREYFDHVPAADASLPGWIDLSFELQGDIAQQGRQQFEQDWDYAGEHEALSASSPVSRSALGGQPAATVQLVPSGPDRADDTIYSLLVSACYAAQTRIVAVSPYFVPDTALTMALNLAAKRGVQIDLLLPAQSNHRLADWARGSALRELAAAGARIWLLDTMIHAKAVVFDERMALAGSCNLDERSLFLNFELSIAFYALEDIRQFAAWIDRQRTAARLYTPPPRTLGRDLMEGAVRWLAFQL